MWWRKGEGSRIEERKRGCEGKVGYRKERDGRKKWRCVKVYFVGIGQTGK